MSLQDTTEYEKEFAFTCAMLTSSLVAVCEDRLSVVLRARKAV